MDGTRKISGMYILISVLMLIIEIFNYTSAYYIVKPLITITLILYLYSNTQQNSQRTIVTIALIFSLVGDVLLLNPNNPNCFIFGLISFLLVHLSYISAFSKDIKLNNTFLPKKIIIPAILIILNIATYLYVFLFDHLGEMLIPVSIYMTIIITMVITALLRNSTVNHKSFYKIVGGSLFFLVSDSILAIDKFATPIKYGNFWIILTYIIAQYFIIDGIKNNLLTKDTTQNQG